MVNAVAVLNGTGSANGQVNFVEKGRGPTQTVVSLSDFDQDGDYELVVHLYGDISSQWKSTGPILRDLGTITIKDGTGYLNVTYDRLDDTIIGKGFVVHADGDSGPGVVWGVIGVAP